MRNLYVFGLVVAWVIIFLVPTALYFKRHIEKPGKLPENNGGYKEYFNQLSSKVSSHKETFDKAIKDISEKMDKALKGMDAKIAKLHQTFHQRREGMAKVLKELPAKKEHSADSSALNSKGKWTRGEIRQGKKCIDTMERTNGGFPEMYRCHSQGGNQAFQFTVNNQLMNPHRKDCITAPTSEGKTIVEMRACTQDNQYQKWERSGQQLKLMGEKKCLDVHADGILAVKQCDSNATSQKWMLADFND